jgi:hypothetical protein
MQCVDAELWGHPEDPDLDVHAQTVGAEPSRYTKSGGEGALGADAHTQIVGAELDFALGWIRVLARSLGQPPGHWHAGEMHLPSYLPTVGVTCCKSHQAFGHGFH